MTPPSRGRARSTGAEPRQRRSGIRARTGSLSHRSRGHRAILRCVLGDPRGSRGEEARLAFRRRPSSCSGASSIGSSAHNVDQLLRLAQGQSADVLEVGLGAPQAGASRGAAGLVERLRQPCLRSESRGLPPLAALRQHSTNIGHCATRCSRVRGSRMPPRCRRSFARTNIREMRAQSAKRRAGGLVAVERFKEA